MNSNGKIEINKHKNNAVGYITFEECKVIFSANVVISGKILFPETTINFYYDNFLVVEMTVSTMERALKIKSELAEICETVKRIMVFKSVM